ncbi:hypothetical protein [Xanthobacter agilis]|uniref:Transmembrane protein n=1 Tax=Xanthobacter agilis TaxID=47492 RepID=A0ABU0L9U5_XANAG|nr:hypothetical protein [Xanthobacter agilis]MDQ0503896.1 hypothetical protein [Xanthobacter agilis]
MRFAPLHTLAAALVIALAGSVAVAGSADAQQTQKRTKLTIQKRSYLDAGTMVKPGSKSYLDYALPMDYNYPNYQGSGVGPGPITGLRWPLPGPFDLPGY